MRGQKPILPGKWGNSHCIPPLLVHKNAAVCGQTSLRNTLRPRQAPPAWTKATCYLRASTPGTLSVDKSNMLPPSVHARHPQRGQKQLATTERPRQAPPAWTKATCYHRASTPGTPSVDKSNLLPPGIHTRHPQRGQTPCGLRLLPLGCCELNYKHYGKAKQHENNTLP